MDLAETLAALANGRGGRLILPLVGTESALDLIDRVLAAALSCDPPLILPMPRATETGEPPGVIVTVPTGLPHVYGVAGRYVIRDGTDADATIRPLAPDQLRRLLIARGVLSYEEAVVAGATRDDMDWAAIAVYGARLGAGSLDELILRRGCLIRRDDQLLPTNAGILLFGKDPGRFVRGATITAVRFAGTAMGDQFTRADIGGALPDQIRRAEAFLIDHLRKGVQLGAGMARTEQYEYPLEAAREIVVNAVAHRDYSIAGDEIRLFIFADRLEATSPGKLAGPITLANLAQERFSRNSIIVQVLSDLGFIERLGYGIDRILTLAQTHRLPPPEFVETSGGFRVTLRRNPSPAPVIFHPDESLGLNPRQQSALDFLTTHPRITNKDLQELFPDVHSETIRRDLADLVTKGKLQKLGEKRGSYYVLSPEK